MRNFVVITNPEGKDLRVINLDLIWLVDEIRPGHIRLHFTSGSMLDIDGPGAPLLLARIGNRAIAVDGTELTIGPMNAATPAPAPADDVQQPASSKPECQVQ